MSEFGKLFPSVGGASRPPAIVEQARVAEVTALGQARLGTTLRPPVPTTLAPAETGRIIDARVDVGRADTWALTYLPPLNPVLPANDPMLGSPLIIAANAIGAPWPAASGFPAGTELIDSRRARGILDLGQGGIRSGRLDFDISAGGVLQVPAGDIQFSVTFLIGSVGLAVPPAGNFPLPEVPAYRAFLTPGRPARPQGHHTARVGIPPTLIAGATATVMFAVPVGARTFYTAGFADVDGDTVPGFGRVVLFSRTRDIHTRIVLEDGSAAASPAQQAAAFNTRQLPDDTVAIGVQMPVAVGTRYAASVGFEMAW